MQFNIFHIPMLYHVIDNNGKQKKEMQRRR